MVPFISSGNLPEDSTPASWKAPFTTRRESSSQTGQYCILPHVNIVTDFRCTLYLNRTS